MQGVSNVFFPGDPKNVNLLKLVRGVSLLSFKEGFNETSFHICFIFGVTERPATQNSSSRDNATHSLKTFGIEYSFKTRHWTLNHDFNCLCINCSLQTCYLLKLSQCNILCPSQTCFKRLTWHDTLEQ